MDKIKIDIKSLTVTDTAISDMANSIASIAQKCSSEINNNLHGADEKLKSALEEYLEHLSTLNSNVAAFATENKNKSQRLAAAIYEYSKSSYNKRNF